MIFILFDLKRKIYYMAYEKILGSPHPDLRKRRLNRLQKEQMKCLDGSRICVNQDNDLPDTENISGDEGGDNISPDPNIDTGEASIDKPTDEFNEDQSTSSVRTINNDYNDAEQEMHRAKQDQCHGVCNISRKTMSSSSININQSLDQSLRNKYIRYCLESNVMEHC